MTIFFNKCTLDKNKTIQSKTKPQTHLFSSFTPRENEKLYMKIRITSVSHYLFETKVFLGIGYNNQLNLLRQNERSENS